MSETSNAKKEPTIQEQLDELARLIAWFQSPEFVLEESLDKYKQAEQLADSIEERLMQLKNEIAIVSKRFDDEN